MTNTRRKSKAAAEQSAETPEAAASQPIIRLTLPDDLDIPALTKILPEADLETISPEDVIALFRLAIFQAENQNNAEQERDEAYATLQRKEVELEQALQDREGLSRDTEQSLEVAQEELGKVKHERDQLANEKATLQTQLTNVSTSQSTSTTEVESLKRRLDDSEREKRELVGLITRLKDEATQREEEVLTLRTNLKEARQEHQALETSVRELRAAETATRFRIESLEQQLHLSQAEVERVNNELAAKSEEFGQYRRAKHAEIATLQASADTATQSTTSSEASLKALQSVHAKQGHQLTQALAKVQDLTGQLAEQEARYANEVNGLKRLVSMMEEREKQAKEIVENVEREWATVGQNAETRETTLRDEAERERKAREEAERRLQQLETVMEKMGRGELPLPARGLTSTPLRGGGTPDSTIDGMMGLSPTVALASQVQRAGKTFTEVYADYVRLQEDYAKKCAEYDHMDRTLSSVLAQIEERAPILNQQRREYDRLQEEAAQLGSQLSQALSERDAQACLAQDATQKLSTASTENNFLHRQLEDVSRQVQHLLRQVARHDDPTIPPDEELELIPGEPLSDTETLITNHLVLFKNVDDLQRQNQRLLKVVREISSRMESEEREYREVMEREQAEAIREAHEAMQDLATQLERQKQSSDGVIKAYVKERDALRAMLARTEREGGVVVSGTNAASAASPDLVVELAEVQSQFDAYRLEMGIDSGRLRDELISAQREINTISADLAKANAKVDYMSDRLRMHEEQFRVHHLELDELTKRNTQLSDQNLRLDIECAQAVDELQVARGRLEQLRNDSANLRAEKKIWEGIQGRLVEENRTLAMERSHLSDLMSNVQKMHNDLERSGENDRRRLEGQLQMLENQTQDLRAQLVQERESIRHVTLQKDLDLRDLQSRIDKHTLDFSKTREALVEAQTSKKHLEEKVDDLTRQLKGNEEKLSVYERRPGASAPSQQAGQEVSREQQLEAEVADLRSTLKVTEVDLAAAKSHRDQYQEISQANEAALAALNTTFDEYKTSTEVTIARHESEVKALQQRLEHANEELAAIRGQLSENQKAFEGERTAWINDKKVLEDTIVDLSTSEKRTENDRSSREQDLKALEERATNAEQRYSQEIISHAESMKNLDNLKKELAAAQAASRQHKTTAQTAEAKLASSESSWKLQKDALDKEVSDLNTRCQELSQQNATLHQHLETVSAQATRIRNAADAPVDGTTEGETSATDDADSRLSELRSVVSYLRKEKGIVDLQLEMAKRENGVLKSQIDRLSQALQEARTSLTEERERALQNSASPTQHAELVERINQLNILRESNATLRAECENANRKSRELETRLQQLSSELDPAREQARSATAELESTKTQMQRLEQESRRWQERNAQLLTKYDRVDPSEVQALRDELAQLKKDAVATQEKLTEKESAVDASTKRIEALEGSIRHHKEIMQKNLQTFKAKMNNSAVEKKQLEVKISSLDQENSSLKAAQATQANGAPVTNSQTEELEKQKALVATLQAERDKLAAEKDALVKAQPSSDANSTMPGTWETEKAQLIKARDEALENLKMAESNVQKATNEARTVKFQNDKFQARIQDLMRSKAADAEKQAQLISNAVEKAKSETTATPDGAAAEDVAKRHAEELHALGDKLKAEHNVALKAALEEAAKSQTSAPTTDQQAVIDAAIVEYEKGEWQARLEKEVSAAVERGRMEQAAKTKLKDSQLVRAQKRVKELESQIHEWKAAGIDLPPSSAPSTSATPLATASPATSVPKPGPSTPQTATAKPALTSAAPAGPKASPITPSTSTNVASLPKKPGVATAPAPATPTGPAASVAARGGAALRGRGAAPRGAPLRGGVPVRGGAPQRQPPVKPAAAASAGLSGGVSIMGAAAKRPREENGSGAEDSLAKRLKPTEGAGQPAPVRRTPTAGGGAS